MMRNSLDLGTDHHQHLLQSGLLKTNYGDMCDRYYGFQTEAGKSVDPRLMRVLEFFREVYIRKRETFMKLIPEFLHEGYEDLFKEISFYLTRAKPMHGARTLQRSLSVGSELKLERFRVRAVNAGHGGGGSGGDVQSIGQGGQGDKPKVDSGSK